jgi:hypothetical protein
MGSKGIDINKLDKDCLIFIITFYHTAGVREMVMKKPHRSEAVCTNATRGLNV